MYKEGMSSSLSLPQTSSTLLTHQIYLLLGSSVHLSKHAFLNFSSSRSGLCYRHIGYAFQHDCNVADSIHRDRPILSLLHLQLRLGEWIHRPFLRKVLLYPSHRDQPLSQRQCRRLKPNLGYFQDRREQYYSDCSQGNGHSYLMFWVGNNLSSSRWTHCRQPVVPVHIGIPFSRHCSISVARTGQRQDPLPRQQRCRYWRRKSGPVLSLLGRIRHAEFPCPEVEFNGYH